MRLVSWNINSVRMRLANIQNFCERWQPDIVCLQETKCQDFQFPTQFFEESGYQLVLNGQKSYNGVAIATRYPLENIQTQFFEDDTQQARFLSVDITSQANSFRLVNIYVPNGNPVDSIKYDYKIMWLTQLRDYLRHCRRQDIQLCILGDWNIIPTSQDVYNPQNWDTDALFQSWVRDYWQALLAEGFLDALRLCRQEANIYSFWDYQAAALKRNHGLRIDHVLLTPLLADKLQGCLVDKESRHHQSSSDHAPLIIDLAF